MIRYMERSTTYGCHFIDEPLSSFILRIDPPELPSHARWWVQQTSSVGGRDFLPRLWGCFKFSSFTELSGSQDLLELSVELRTGFLCSQGVLIPHTSYLVYREFVGFGKRVWREGAEQPNQKNRATVTILTMVFRNKIN